MNESNRILPVIEATGFVSYDGRDGVITSRASVHTRYGTSVTLTSWDGIRTSLEATAHRTLDQQLTGYRPATPEEVAEYERLEATLRPYKVRVTEVIEYDTVVSAVSPERAQEQAIDEVVNGLIDGGSVVTRAKVQD